VVDDSPQPSVGSSEFPSLDLHVVRHESRQFISAARNRGLAMVDEEYVLMVDDDNVVVPETFDHPLRSMEEDSRLAAVMPAAFYREAPDLVWVYACPFLPGRWKFQLIGRNRPRDPVWENRVLPTDALPNAAFFRRDRLREAGGYDPQLPVNSSADLCQRLKGAGGSVRADSHAWTFHDVEPPGRPGFWGAHGGDAERTVWERRDWFVLQRRLHPSGSFFPLQALVHAAPFLASSGLSYLLREDVKRGALVLASVRGIVKGLRDAAADDGGRGYPRFD
jgi:glycosyltransferase involved in cell wall biosynthesis